MPAGAGFTMTRHIECGQRESAGTARVQTGKSRPGPFSRRAWARWARVWALVGLLLGFAPNELVAQWSSSWRIYKAADGLADSSCSAVTIEPRGERVWVKHGAGEFVSCLDGYDVSTVRAAGEPNSRVYENKQGLLWTTYPEGIERWRGGNWEKLRIPDIERENRTNVIRRMISPIPLVPILSQSVLVALPDRVFQYDAGPSRMTLIKSATNTPLGYFNDLEAGPGTAFWMSATRGLIRFTLPSARTPATWEEFVCPASLGVRNFQHLSVDEHGGVTTVAELTERKERVLVHYDNAHWEVHNLLRGRLLQAWVGPDNTFWAHSLKTLSRLGPDRTETIELENLVTGQINDVATEPKGVFWLATSDGLARYAPSPWRTPSELAGLHAEVFGMVQDPKKRLWFAASSGLIQYSRGEWKQYTRPDTTDLDFRPSDTVYCLTTGDLALRSGDNLLLFDPNTERFRVVTHPQRRAMKLLGQLADQELCVQTLDPDAQSPTQSYRLESFDGRAFRLLADTNATRTFGGELNFCLQVSNRDLWIGGAGGVALWRDEKLQTFSRADGAVPEAAYCMLEMGNGKIWCGGLGKIFEFDSQHWSVAQIGFDRVNCLIRAQDGTIWAASNEGIHRYLQGSWLLNNTEEGLPSTVVYEVFQDDKGVFWAGTARGLSRYHPDADIDAPKGFITSANGLSTFPLDTPIVLTLRGQDKWKFTASDRLLFSTRVDTDKWTPFGSQVTVPVKGSLPGKHRLEARVMDRNGNVDLLNPAAFEFLVVLPWYLETRLIMIVAAGLVACLGFGGLAINRHLRLKRSYAEVGRIVQERTAELNRAHEALLHSQKMQALGTLSAGIAHDFNNILSIIQGSVQIIAEHLDDKNRVMTRLDRIKTMVEQGASIVKAMLGYSRPQSGEAAPCDINQVVEETIKLLGDRFLQGIVLQRQLEPGLPPVMCVKELMQQILLNLIINASEAMAGEGKIVLLTGLAKAFPDNCELAPKVAPQYVMVAVQDAGCGINAEVRARIFEPFFTTKALSTRRGTGLGLSMVYEFARTQGLGIHVRSEVGRGSVFTLYMPLGPLVSAKA